VPPGTATDLASDSGGPGTAADLVFCGPDPQPAASSMSAASRTTARRAQVMVTRKPARWPRAGTPSPAAAAGNSYPVAELRTGRGTRIRR
jgi:hypothetical protein